MFSKELAKDGNALNEALKERLQQHNTFLRGVYIDEKYVDDVYRQLVAKGVEPTKENALEYLATHYLPETGHGGRAGFYSIPDVRNSYMLGKDLDQQIGTIYTSNGLDQAGGYALRGGKNKYNGVFMVRRPLSFEGSREDQVLNAEFPLWSGGQSYDKSNTYYQYELPYLMQTGKAVPKQMKVNYDLVNRELQDRANDFRSNDTYQEMLQIYKDNNRTPKLKAFGTGNHFLNYRMLKLYDLLTKMRNRNVPPADITDHFRMSPEQYRIQQNQSLYPPQILDKFELIANSRNYRNKQNKEFKFDFDEFRKRLIFQNRSFTTPSEIKDFVIESGVTPNKPITNIGTSEQLKTSTINSDPRTTFQHFIFTGTPGRQGLEIVKRIPYEEWKDLAGDTSHHGTWYPGTSRKSKKNGGKLELANN